MIGEMMEVQAFEMNGWTIRPCSEDGFDLIHGDELYHHTHLEVAVATAQRSPRHSPVDRTGDPVELAREWVRALKDNTTPRGDLLHVLEGVLARLDRFEKDMPSWAHGTPEDYDAWLRELTPADRRLKFYQWIGDLAGQEIIDEITSCIGQDPVPATHRVPIPDMVWEAISYVDTRQGADPAPSVLPKGKHKCDVPHHTHTDGMGYLPTCRLDSPE